MYAWGRVSGSPAAQIAALEADDDDRRRVSAALGGVGGVAIDRAKPASFRLRSKETEPRLECSESPRNTRRFSPTFTTMAAVRCTGRDGRGDPAL